MNARDESRKSLVVSQVLQELIRAERKFPDQTLPWGGDERWTVDRDGMRALCNARLAKGSASWVDVLREEYYEALAESDWIAARPEIIQLAAMCIRTILDCDQKAASLPPKTFAQPRGPAVRPWEGTPLPLERRELDDGWRDVVPPNAGSVD